LENYALPQIREEDSLRLKTLTSETNIEDDAVTDQNKRFGTLLLNLTNPFNNFGPMSAGFTFNVSSGRTGFWKLHT